MPIYTFECTGCGYKEEVLESCRDKDTATYACPKCKEPMRWQGVELPVFKVSGNYQMKAITEQGEHVAGHFGKDAKRARK